MFQIEIIHIVYSALLVVVASGVSLLLGLNLEKKFLIAKVRTIVQLVLLGYVLLWLFNYNKPVTFFVAFIFMVLVATQTISNRVGRKFKGLKIISFNSIFFPCLITGFYTFFLAIPQTPWFDVSKTIPLFGMIIGNSLTGISLSLDSLVNNLVTKKKEIEDMLSMGATRYEALRPLMKQSLKTGMTPILNAMSVVGLVSIPGMMTGQILAGADPFEAAKYQINIMFIICFVIFFSSIGALLITVLRFFDDNHRYRQEVFLDE